MPLLAAILYLIPAIYFAIHVVKNRQNYYWLFILFVFPVVGSITYAFSVWLPEFRHTRHANRLESKIKSVLNPDKDIREAQRQYDIAPTTEHCLMLADAYADKERYQDAAHYFNESLQGHNQSSPDILLRYADTLFHMEDYSRCKEILDTLTEHNPGFVSAPGHLLYARTLANLDRNNEADEEFKSLMAYQDRIEIKISYASFLIDNNRNHEALPFLEQVLTTYNLMPKSAQRFNRQWKEKATVLKQQITQ